MTISPASFVLQHLKSQRVGLQASTGRVPPLLLKASSRQPEREDGHGDGRRGGEKKSKSMKEKSKTNTDIKSH